jgi:hypothetical protein
MEADGGRKREQERGRWGGRWGREGEGGMYIGVICRLVGR